MTFESSSEITASIVSLARIGRCWSPSFAPDGDELAFISDLTGKPQVWRMPAAGGFPSAVTAFDEQVSLVIWSPDGRWLAVESAPGGGMNSQIDIVRPDGSDRRRLTAGGSSNNWLGAWTKDGRSLLYSSNQESADTMECFRITLDTGATEKLTSAGGTTVIEDSSADGARLLIKRVAYRGDNNLYLLETSSGGERLLTAHDPHWFEILRVTSRYDVAWCDPGGVPARFGACVLDVPVESLADDAAGAGAEEAR